MESTKWGGQLIEVTTAVSDGAELLLCNKQQPGATEQLNGKPLILNC